MDWESVKSRLGEWANGYSSVQPYEQHRADILAALERVEELERQAHTEGPMIAAGWRLFEKRVEELARENAEFRASLIGMHERENAEFRASLIGMHERAEAAEQRVKELEALLEKRDA